MTRQIVWKEAREQGAVLLALVGLGAGLMAAATILGGATGAAEGLSVRTVNYTGRILLILLVSTAGVVAGGSLFAGERESGTFIFLDHLPASRWRVWWRKVLAGGLLTFAASMLLLTAAGLAGQLGGGTRTVLVGWTLAMLVLAAIGYGWGVFGSTRAESSLSACGIGLLGSFVTVVIVVVGLALVFGLTGRWLPNQLGIRQTDEGGLVGLLAFWSLLFIPLPWAALRFTAPDRNRRLAEQDIRPRQTADMPRQQRQLPRLPGIGGLGRSRRMRWLLWHQLRAMLVVLAALGFGAGLLLVPWNEDWPSSLLWPAVGLVIGVLAGVSSLGDEQRSGAVRFWAERRLPIGRLWFAKAVNGAALTLAASLAALLPVFFAAVIGPRNSNGVLSALFVSGLFEPGFPHLTYLFLGPAYGFAFGHLAGMLFRKGIVAGAVGLMVGGTFGAVWGLSLFGGGVHGWMLFVPPVVALLTARWLAWPWATDQIGRRGSLLRLAVGTLAAAGCIVAGLAYRAVGDIEDVANARDHLRFRDALPTFDENQPGRDIRRALNKWTSEVPESVRTEATQVPLVRRTDAWANTPHGQRYASQMWELLRDGWPTDRPDADAWMDRAFEGNWDETVFAAAAKPPGVLEDPNEYNGLFQPLRYINPFQELTPLFLARGLHLQSRGDPADFVRRLDAWLAACRTAKRHTMPIVAIIAEGCELRVYQALDRWLERLAGQPDLVRQALEVVRKHDTLDVPDPADTRLAVQTVFQNAVDAPGQWLPRWLEGSTNPRGGVPPGAQIGNRPEAEAELTAFAWVVPWEKERLRRAVALGNDPNRRTERAELLEGAPGLGMYAAYDRLIFKQEPYSDKTVAARRAAVVKLALRLHHLSAGRYPESLDALVPGILPSVPLDPYNGQPLRYRRLAKAEMAILPANLAPRQRHVLPPGATLPYRDYLAVAGLAGGLVGWPFEPGWYTPEAEEGAEAIQWRARGTTGSGEPGMGASAADDSELPLAAEWRAVMTGTEERLAVVRLLAGRAVVWSVGPDKQDGGGLYMDERDEQERRVGQPYDLVYPVPDPPAASPAAPAPGR